MKVIAVIKSKVTEDAEPTEMTWYNGTGEAGALSAVANLMNTREAEYTEILSVRVEF